MTGAATPPARRLAEADVLRLGTDIQRRIGVKTSRNEPLARFTTMRVGGPADLFAEVHNLFELRAIVRFARSREVPLFLLGRGSDLVIADAGIGGLVVQVRAQQVAVAGERFTADAGLPMAKDIPDKLDIHYVESPRPAGPFGAAGVGELPRTSPHVAIVNAIYNATGVRITHLPAYPEKVLAGLKALAGDGHAERVTA